MNYILICYTDIAQEQNKYVMVFQQNNMCYSNLWIITPHIDNLSRPLFVYDMVDIWLIKKQTC